MTCKEFLALLDDMIDDTVTAETRNEIRAHLERCPHCKVTFDTTRKTIEIYRSHEIFELPDDLRERLHSAIMTRCIKGF